jgi:kinesin family protein 4/21/27
MNEPVDKDYAFRQAKMQYQLSEYDTELMKKQFLFQKMLENNINSQHATLDSNMDELKSKIDTLEKEKEELMETIRSSDTRKLAEQKRDRLKQLEIDVFELKKKEKELVRTIKLKEENEKHCEKLRAEIQHIKQERVKLIKQMKSDTEQFRKYKQDKEKEVNQLKALERKRLVEISKLQEGNNRQENILRRKNEEITRIQKQLRETSEKQKQVAEKRQQAFDRKESSQIGERLRGWMTQEIELSVGLAEARINLNRLIEERKESGAELTKLAEKLEEMKSEEMGGGGAPAKRNKPSYDMDATYIAGSRAVEASANEEEGGSSGRAKLEQQIERLREEIECKNVQINEIQQMVIEGDLGRACFFV